MKRGKEEEEEKGVGPEPMFPRLHVNDTEKGGPRAPPRNKMALYEQFSVPSQRFNNSKNTRLLPITKNSNNAPQSSSCQGTGLERSYVFPAHSPSQAPSRRERYISQSHQSNGANQNTSLVQLEQRKSIDEDDFTVPVYNHLRNFLSNDKTQESFDSRNLTPIGSGNVACFVAVENDSDRGLEQFGSSSLVDIRKDIRREIEGLPQVSSSREQLTMYAKSTSTRETMDSLVRKTKLIPNQEGRDYSVSNVSKSHRADACIQVERVAGSGSNDSGHVEFPLESTRDTVKGNTLVPRGFFSSENQTSPQEVNDECDDTRTSGPTQEGNSDASENISKISSVENLSSSKASPDDAVCVLGQKHFWKARREIAKAMSSLKILLLCWSGTLVTADHLMIHCLDIFLSWFPLTWFSM